MPCREVSLIIFSAYFADFSEKTFAFTDIHAAGRFIENSSKPDLTSCILRYFQKSSRKIRKYLKINDLLSDNLS